MKNHSDITVVSVTGLQSVALGAIQSIKLTSEALPGSKRLLISPEKPFECDHDIEHVAIKEFGYFEYSIFIIYCLHNFISTDFALIVQDDGWAVNPNNWCDDFYQFDYIGAPNHFARVKYNGRETLHKNFSWTKYIGIDGASIDVVQNGGFSFRSKKLLEMPSKLNMKYCISPPRILPSSDLAMRWDDDSNLEDVWLCHIAKSVLESNGIVFAPVDVAKKFSIEHAGPNFHLYENDFETFGQHSKLRKLSAINNRTVDYSCSIEQINEIYGESKIIQKLIECGFSIRY